MKLGRMTLMKDTELRGLILRKYYDLMEDESKVKGRGRGLYTFLRNEPNLFSSENRIYIIGWQ